MSEEKRQCDSKSCTKEDCAGCSHAKGAGVPKENLNAHSKIKKVIGVVSGKGGVGKSLVTASLANEMAFQGYRVGIMDADITGPSIPRMYGLKGSAVADDKGIYPMETGNDVKVMSVNLFTPSGRCTGYLERTNFSKYGKTVLDRCCLGRIGLPFCRYATGNRRCTSYCIPVSSD